MKNCLNRIWSFHSCVYNVLCCARTKIYCTFKRVAIVSFLHRKLNNIYIKINFYTFGFAMSIRFNDIHAPSFLPSSSSYITSYVQKIVSLFRLVARTFIHRTHRCHFTVATVKTRCLSCQRFCASQSLRELTLASLASCVWFGCVVRRTA